MAQRHAPATLRNRDAIAAVLMRELPASGTVLEMASGTGEHAVFFAAAFPALNWQPTDSDPDALASIAAYLAAYPGANLAPPLPLDAASPDDWWQLQADAVLCINMVHISPWAATTGLFEGAAQVLAASMGPLILYGPFVEHGVTVAPSNLAFDADLQLRDPAWGLRRTEALDAEAKKHGMTRTSRHPMPANNLMLVYTS